MKLDNVSALVSGGASGLARACVEALLARGGRVVIVDLPTSEGAEVAASFGEAATFVPADVTDPDGIARAISAAERNGPLRALVHCAGHGGAVRTVEKDGNPGSLEGFRRVVETNLVGTFNVLRLAAAAMARNELEDGERGAVVLTASVAAFEGQVGQIPYASSKGGVVAMTIVAARDLASRGIRVNTIAPGIFDTPLLARLPGEVKTSLAKTVPNPARLGRPIEFAGLAMQLLENPYINGETIRIDGAIRMQPR